MSADPLSFWHVTGNRIVFFFWPNKSVAYKKPCNIVLEANKHEEITFSQEFIFVLISHFIGAISSKKNVKRGEFGTKM